MKKFRTCNVALMVFFLLYALSPLTYNLTEKSITSDLFRGMSERSLRNASLYLVEALYEAFFPPDESGKDPSPNRVLIRKNSAVQRSKFDAVPQSGNSAVFSTADLTACLHFSLGSERAEIVWPWLGKSSGCLPLSSGLSPPLLS